MAERKITNNSILLFLGEDAGELDTVVCLTSIKEDFTIDEMDATTICGGNKVAGELSGNISIEAQHLLDPATGKVSGHSIFEWMVAKTTLFYRIGPAVPEVGDVIQDGVCFISSLGNSYSLNTQSTFSATLTIKGVPVEDEYVFVTPPLIPITGLWAWFDAALGVTGTTSVTVWDDQSGHGRNLTTTTTPKPTLIASAQNGLPAISSYGVVTTMTTTAFFPDISAGGTVFLVAKQSDVNGATDSDDEGVFIGASVVGDMLIKRGNITSGDLASIRGGISATSFLDTAAVVPDDTFVSIRLRNDGVSNYLSINDTTEVTGDTDGTIHIISHLTIFKTATGAQGNKQIAEIIIYTRNLTSDEIAEVEDYLNTKYAL